MKTIVVTGGSGFVGTNLVDYFSRAGWRVWNFDLRPPRNPAHARFWKPVDICNRKAFEAAVSAAKPAALLHCAARTDLDEARNLDGYRANLDGVCNTIAAVRTARSIRRVIFFSTQLVCRLGYRPKDDRDYQPDTLYGRSKALGEEILRAASPLGAFWTIVRPTSLWGPWFDIPYRSFFSTVRSGLYFHPWHRTVRKQWGYIGNAVFQVDRILRAPVRRVNGRTFYLADYAPLDLRDFADAICIAAGRGPVRTAPAGLLRLAAFAGDAGKRLGWKNPPLTSFRLGNILADELQAMGDLPAISGPLPFSYRDGIRETVRWLRTVDPAWRSSERPMTPR